MASINSLMSSTSSTSSIYGNSNIISGLASGMDTEAMIENAVSGIKNKIAGFNQNLMMLEWEQSAYRSIIDRMVNFSTKYFSFSSGTNLLSNSFFESATKVTASGKNADLISAVGSPTSQVRITSVSKLAEAATFKPTTAIAGGGGLTGSALNLTEDLYTSEVSGILTLGYGDQTYSLAFGQNDIYKTKDELVTSINEKLKAAGLEGKVEATQSQDGSGIQFDIVDTGDDAGTELKITGATGKLAETLGIGDDKDIKIGDDINGKSFVVSDSDLYHHETRLQSMVGKEFSFTLDGMTKKITLSESDVENVATVADLAGVLNDKLGTAFGAGKVSATATDGGALSFAPSAGSTLSIEGAESLGLSEKASSGVDTSLKLSELGFAAGDNGYSFTMNGKTLTFGADATLDDVINAVNKDADIGVKISYSKITGEFMLTSKETGTAGRIEIKAGDADKPNLAEKLFGEVNKIGTDAELDMEINGKTLTGVKRSSNTFDVDGMTITLKGTFSDEAVSFTSSTDADKIVNAVKSMVEDFNTMANEIKDAYTTKPLTTSSGKRYKPLTDEDSKDMSEDAIKRYEEKAKTGLLFADSDLSSLYNELRTAISSLDLEEIGITTAYSNGKTTMVLDEEKLRDVAENNVDKVKDVLTRQPDGTTGGGLMYNLQQTTEKYAKTTGDRKGILIELAGSEKSPASLLNNDYKSKMERLQEQITRWQDKMADKVDYYTRQFTALEKLISDMNAQSSALYGMMGY